MTMNAENLDLCYTQLANALADVGSARAPLLLSTLALSFITAHNDPAEVQRLIAQAQALAVQGNTVGLPA